MGTYYRWRKSTPVYVDSTEAPATSFTDNSTFGSSITIAYGNSFTIDPNSGMYTIANPTSVVVRNGDSKTIKANGTIYVAIGEMNYRFYETASDITVSYQSVSTYNGTAVFTGNFIRHKAVLTAGEFLGYVYDTVASKYPNGNTQNGYYYDQCTSISSPTIPSSLLAPNPIVESLVTINWDASTSQVPGYSVSKYEVSVSINGGALTVLGTTASRSYTYSIPGGTTTMAFYVRAQDSNNQLSNYATTGTIPVLLSPTLTVPSLAMQGQQITPNWTAIDGADSYTLQRKSSADEDWVEVYSGVDTSYTETVGMWTSVQYRVQAVFDETPGGWAISDSIPVISASALVISGQDGDLGTLVNDVPYTISTDTGNAIKIKTTVNGAVILGGTVTSGTSERIPVLDLVSGSGTIVIEASVETDSGPVSAVRTWTYHKAPITFPNAGSPAQLTKEGKNIWPKTLAECVRLSGGRTLDEVMGFPCQVFMGSYIGTGVYGVDSPNELTFPFKPKAVVIGTNMEASETYNQYSYPWLYGLKRGTISTNGTQYEILTWEGNTLSWYYFQQDGYGANRQFNAQGVEYFYVAFG